MVVGRLLSYREGNISGAMLNFMGVKGSPTSSNILFEWKIPQTTCLADRKGSPSLPLALCYQPPSPTYQALKTGELSSFHVWWEKRTATVEIRPKKIHMYIYIYEYVC